MLPPKKLKKMKKFVRTHPLLILFLIIGTGYMSAIVYTQYAHPKRLTVDPDSYRPLLHLIAQAESKDNYNAYFGHANNTSIQFTAMSLAEVMNWQKQSVASGSASSAVGRYQIIDTTLQSLVHELGLNPQQKFDQPTQDRLAVALLERRGGEQYVNRELSQHEFAANIAKEWAALPRVTGSHPDTSYYADDSLNQALVPVDHVLKAITPIRAQ